ncbi:MAG: hypothetical protein K2G55_19320 [Lachnospiraceae bacterium]|nr:hypothetical protein [Lachnospiraceae bacterium]MDE7202821.1 hypothetical protein [Lachnospiraceae bacterium]
MKEKTKNRLIIFVGCIPLIIIAICIGIECYDAYIVKTKELVLDPCIVRGVSYDGKKTLLVVELPDHSFSIVDASVHLRYTYRPVIKTGDLIRCRWKYGDTGKLGYSSKQKGDIHY